MEYRNNFIKMFLGFNRTGKTSEALRVTEVWRDANSSRKSKVVVFDPQNRFSKIADEKTTEVLPEWEEYINTLFVFDDYRALHPSNSLNPIFMKMFVMREESCNDMIFITHAPSLILERLSYFVTEYYIYHTQTTDRGFKQKVMNYSELMEISSIVNRYTQKHGVGEYPVFPHVIFNNLTSDISFVNFGKKGIIKS